MGYRLTGTHGENGPGRMAALLMLAAMLWQCLAPPGASAALFGSFTIRDELELGRKFNVLIRSTLPIVQDPEVVMYVEDIVARMGKHLPPQPAPFTISVIRNNSLNAFATPGGYLFIHTGLILAMEHESELAAVIGHEMAHVTQRHIARRIEQAQTVSILSLLGALAGAFLGGEAGSAALAGSMAGGQAALLNYSRHDENEADQVGMSYFVKAGYNPKGMVGAFEKMSRKQWIMGGSVPAYLSTHPGLGERINNMTARINLLPADIRNRPDNDTRFLRIQALIRARYSDPDAAGQAFARQVSGPQRCMALMGRGILASRLNRVQEAAAAFDEAMKCAPNDELIVREAGRFHYTKGNRTLGAELLRKAVAMDRNDTMALFFHARSLADAGQTREAISHIRQVLRKVPEDSEVHEYLARYYAQDNQLFLANLHMAYSALYANNAKRTEQFQKKAAPLARTPEEERQLKRFQEEYKDRRQYW